MKVCLLRMWLAASRCITGKTLDAKYALWSVGFDSEDNHGERGSNGDKGETADPSKEGYLGDWVWDFPGK
jgi:hypothetical protein